MKAMLDLFVFGTFVVCIGANLVAGNYPAAWFSFTTAVYYCLYVIEIESKSKYTLTGERKMRTRHD